jgi:hypothetical protein
MFSGLHKTCGQEECRDGTRQVRSGRAPVGMRLRRQGVCTFAGAGRVYEFETTGCIVSCTLSAARLHRIQRPHPGTQITAQCDSARSVPRAKLNKCPSRGNRIGAIRSSPEKSRCRWCQGQAPRRAKGLSEDTPRRGHSRAREMLAPCCVAWFRGSQDAREPWSTEA